MFYYHIEIFRSRNIVSVQDQANAYLEECKALEAQVVETHLDYLDGEYHLTITLALPAKED